ncbi:MAG: hypothetical protein KDA84_02145, partial [Planctomycetaceae bacterium]|nr:hypothetical protein [Planctomycetaceae bacterium]
TLGPTYSVFIPYSRKGQHQAQCALRVCLAPENGKPIYSDTSAVILPGLLKKKVESTEEPKPKVDPRTSLKSLTIPLKENRRQNYSEPRLGESSIERVIAPVSELTRRAALRSGQPIHNPSVSHESSPRNTPAMSSLPAPPPQTLPNPVMPAKPLEQVVQPPSPAHPRTTEVGFRSQAIDNLEPRLPANSYQQKQPVQSSPFAQPNANSAQPTRQHPLGNLNAAQPIQSGT